MDRKRLIFWTTFLGGAGAVAVLPDLIPHAPQPQAVEPVARPASTQAVDAAASARAVASAAQAAASAAEAAIDVMSVAYTLEAAPPPAPRPELFAAKSWKKPPPPPPPPPPPGPPPPPPPPPPPAAPPLPYSFMGRFEDDGKVKVFLQRGEKLYALSAGDTVEGQYRVERIDAGQMTLRYLPLDIPQTLAFGKQ